MGKNTKTLTASRARRHLQKLADEKTAAIFRSFFKTGPGEYAEGEKFLGIRTAALRLAASKFALLPLDELDQLLQSPIHEHRSLALAILVDRYAASDSAVRRQIYRHILARTKYINHWDLVDSSAPQIIGRHLLADRECKILYRLAKSKLWWERRIAVVATQEFIRNGRFDVTLELAVRLMTDKHDLMHKAIGWMLREIGKNDDATLRAFLDKHGREMSRTTLRYAIEKFSAPDRKRYLAMKR